MFVLIGVLISLCIHYFVLKVIVNGALPSLIFQFELKRNENVEGLTIYIYRIVLSTVE